jgi:uncharacterized membrane protein YfcA
MQMPDLSAHQWLLAAIAALAVGLSKSGFAGVGMLTVLLMAEIMPARESTGALLPLLICGDIFAVAVFRKHAQWRHILRMLLPAFVGILAGYAVMGRIPDSVFRPVIGWIVLILAALQFLRRRFPGGFQNVPHSRWFAWVLGTWSGVTTMLANAAGPIMTLYLLAVELPKFALVGTSAWFFLMVNVVKVPFSYDLGLINGTSVTLDLILVPGVLAGIAAGRLAIGFIPQKLFEQLILLFAAIASVRLIWF